MSVIHTVNEKASHLGNVASALGDVTIDSMEALLRNNLESCAYYSAIAIRQLRSAANIHDFDSLRQHMVNSVSAAGEVAKRAINDGQFIAGMGARFKDELAQKSAAH